MAVYELASRKHDGLIVRLLWDSVRGQVVLRYRDLREDDVFRVDVPNTEALTAFEHPNAYRPDGCTVAAVS